MKASLYNNQLTKHLQISYDEPKENCYFSYLKEILSKDAKLCYIKGDSNTVLFVFIEMQILPTVSQCFDLVKTKRVLRFNHFSKFRDGFCLRLEVTEFREIHRFLLLDLEMCTILICVSFYKFIIKTLLYAYFLSFVTDNCPYFTTNQT